MYILFTSSFLPSMYILMYKQNWVCGSWDNLKKILYTKAGKHSILFIIQQMGAPHVKQIPSSFLHSPNQEGIVAKILNILSTNEWKEYRRAFCLHIRHLDRYMYEDHFCLNTANDCSTTQIHDTCLYGSFFERKSTIRMLKPKTEYCLRYYVEYTAPKAASQCLRFCSFIINCCKQCLNVLSD